MIVVSRKIETEFLQQSNLIENIDDHDSLLDAIHAWRYMCDQLEMSVAVMLKAHKLLMLRQPLRPNERGYFRTVPVFVAGREMLDHKLIEDRIKYLAAQMWMHPENWREHHIEFEKIHPFVDGNGRLGRMILNWERIKAGLPLLIIYDNEKQKYYEWFNTNPI